VRASGSLSLLLMAGFASYAEADVLAFSCSFSSTCTLDDGCEATEFALNFTVDSQTGFATMIGNVGMVGVTAFVGTEGINFLEQLQNGTTQSTSISRSGGAVHSRHTFISGELAASQFYGVCK
jgi:hypothetical protein